MTRPQELFVRAASPVSYGDAIYRALECASRAARSGRLEEETRQEPEDLAYRIGMKVTLLVRE